MVSLGIGCCKLHKVFLVVTLPPCNRSGLARPDETRFSWRSIAQIKQTRPRYQDSTTFHPPLSFLILHLQCLPTLVHPPSFVLKWRMHSCLSTTHRSQSTIAHAGSSSTSHFGYTRLCLWDVVASTQ
uniref:Uncharacterized protein n=1 Tax=Physcomitrium patens TaxID=3218 RepID=A0A7I3YV09_PHYPA